MQFVDTTSIELAGIPCLYVKPNFLTGNLPTVLIYHGWSGKKESQKFFATILAQHGYAAILPDAIDHGERGGLDFSDYRTLVGNFWRVIFHTVQESPALIKEAFAKLPIIPEKFTVLGVSMGGFAGGGVTALNPEVRGLINIYGSCAWENAENLFIKYDGKGLAYPTQLAEMRKYDPINHKHVLYPRPILLLHGTADELIPLETQHYFYQEMLPLYQSAPDKLKLVEIARLNHLITIGMVEEVIAWLNNCRGGN